MKKEQIPGAITDAEKELNWTPADQEALENQLVNNMLVGSIAYEKTKTGLGHQYRSEEKKLLACQSKLGEAIAELGKDTRFQDLAKAIFDASIYAGDLAAAQRDRFNDNA